MNQNDRSLGGFQGLPTLQHGLIAMRIFHVHLLLISALRSCEVESAAECARSPSDVARAKVEV